MRGLVYMASRDKVNVDTFQKGIQYELEKLGKSKFGFERTAVSNFKNKGHESSGNKLVDYSRAPCLGADQKACGLWERDWVSLGACDSRRRLKFRMQHIYKLCQVVFTICCKSKLFLISFLYFMFSSASFQKFLKEFFTLHDFILFIVHQLIFIVHIDQ